MIFVWTTHALQRFVERFPGLNPNATLAGAAPLPARKYHWLRERQTGRTAPAGAKGVPRTGKHPVTSRYFRDAASGATFVTAPEPGGGDSDRLVVITVIPLREPDRRKHKDKRTRRCGGAYEE